MRLRPALVIRLALGGLLLMFGLANWSDPSSLASFLRTQKSWHVVPAVGGLQPMELSLVLALSRFTAGIFLLGGFITRGMAMVSLSVALLLVWLGAEALAANALSALLALSVIVFGGGGYTLDGVLGRMQRRALDRENRRQAEREAAQQYDEV